MDVCAVLDVVFRRMGWTGGQSVNIMPPDMAIASVGALKQKRMQMDWKFDVCYDCQHPVS